MFSPLLVHCLGSLGYAPKLQISTGQTKVEMKN